MRQVIELKREIAQLKELDEKREMERLAMTESFQEERKLFRKRIQELEEKGK